MKPSRLWYMAHCLTPIEGETLEGNLASAKNHLLSFLKHRKNRVIAPWIAHVETLLPFFEIMTPEERKAAEVFGMDVDLDVVRRCDGIILTGPRISYGMGLEKQEAEKRGLTIIDLTQGNAAYYPGIPILNPSNDNGDL